MLKVLQGVGLPVIAVLTLTVSDASAQRRLTYQQAFALCKKEIGGSDLLNVGGRAAAGAGCMQRHGFRLKKKTK